MIKFIQMLKESGKMPKEPMSDKEIKEYVEKLLDNDEELETVFLECAHELAMSYVIVALKIRL